MKLRLHGTPTECARRHRTAAPHPGLHIQDQGRPYPDRSGELVRVYLTVHLDPTSNRGGGGGRQR